MSKTIGIDLGTTNSCVAVLEGNSVQIIPNNLGGRTTPSVVAFTEKGDRLIGQIAKRQAVTNAANTIHAVKRLMGRRFDAPELQKLRGYISYAISPSETGDARIEVRDKAYSPPEISAMLLQYLKQAAEQFLGEQVMDAVITVPAYFDDSQRQATKDAGRIAGLEVRRIINEPTAAALAYGLGKNERERVAIFDLGGGTFDVSILELNNGVFEVLATCGDSFLGGEDFDQRVVDWIGREFETENGFRLSSDVMTRQRLNEVAEKAKCELSSSSKYTLSLPFISGDARGPRHFERVLHRAEFEHLVRDLIERTTAYCERALKDARLTAAQLDNVILVGGQTRTPAVQRHVAQVFGRQASVEVNPDEVVAVGAALQGGVLRGELKEIILLDVLPLSLGVETQGGLFTRIIDHNSTIPLRKTTVFTTVVDNQSVVDIHVLQGERELARFNRSLGRFDLVGIVPAPRGAPQVEVTFDIDANGIVSVSARDKISGKEQAMRITPSTGLTKDQIDLMVLEAGRYAESDRKLRELAEIRNRIRAQEGILSRSYAEFGWLLEKPDQENLRKVVQQARDLPAQEADEQLLRQVLSELEGYTAALSNAMLNVGRKGGGRDAPGRQAADAEGSVDQLVRSALDDIGSRKKQTSG